MSTQTALGHSFPMPCKRCGGALYRQVDYCPYCGAVHPLDETPYRQSTPAASRAPAMTAPARPFNGAPGFPADGDPAARSAQIDAAIAREAAARDMAARDMARRTSLVSAAMPAGPQAAAPAAPYDEPPFPPYSRGQTGRNLMLAIAAIFLLALTYVLYVLFSDNTDTEDIGEHAAVTTPDARSSTTGTIEPFTSAQSNQPAAVVKSAPAHEAVKPAPVIAATPPTPATPAAPVTPKVAPTIAAAPAPAPSVAAPAARPATPPVATATPTQTPTPAPTISAVPATPARSPTQFRDVSQALQAARVAFRANDLSTAQAALAAAQSLQPGNADAQTLATELRPLAARRDSALQAAQTCVAQQSWPCARQHANEALAIDSSNDAAKQILQRVIRETGWAPIPPHAAAPATPDPAQSKPLAQAQPASQMQPQTQIQAQTFQVKTPLPASPPANGPLTLAAATATPAAGTNSVDAHLRAIANTGWKRAASDGSKLASASPDQ